MKNFHQIVSSIPNQNILVNINKIFIDKHEADFETALAATGFGKFNFILLIIAIPAALAPMFESTTMSFVFPAAQCDLDLTLQNKGTLNAVTYLGKYCYNVLLLFLQQISFSHRNDY